MPEKNSPTEPTLDSETADNAGARTAKIHEDPQLFQTEARNAAEGSAPNEAGGAVPSTVEEEILGTSEPEASHLPTANAPRADDDQHSA